MQKQEDAYYDFVVEPFTLSRFSKGVMKTETI